MTDYKKKCKGIIEPVVVQHTVAHALKEEDDDDDDDGEN